MWGFRFPLEGSTEKQHTGRFPINHLGMLQHSSSLPASIRRDWDEVSWGRSHRLAVNILQPNDTPPTSSGLSCQPPELSPPSPQVSQTRHVQRLKVTISSKPALLSANVTLRKGTPFHPGLEIRKSFLAAPLSPCRCWSHGCQTLALFSLI